MLISISNSVQQTWIFIVLFLIVLLVTARKKTNTAIFPPERTQEIKGFAILAILFCHIGYFLVNDHRFLFPLSILGGVGVDLFLFVSGYGLTASKMRKKETTWQFYRAKLIRLFIPFWIVVTAFLVLDFVLLHSLYSWGFVSEAFLGIFTTAHIDSDFNSPLWYFTLIVFYYLLFPLIFSKKYPWVSALGVYAITYLIIRLHPSVLQDVIELYKVHIMALPLGMLAYCLGNSKTVTKKLHSLFHSYPFLQRAAPIARYILLALLLFLGAYFGYHSGVGKGATLEQRISILNVFIIIGLFIIKKIDFRLFSLFGAYSYEVYLIHWPLMHRYNILYSYIPASLATLFYLLLFLCIGWILQQLSQRIYKWL